MGDVEIDPNSETLRRGFVIALYVLSIAGLLSLGYVVFAVLKAPDPSVALATMKDILNQWMPYVGTIAAFYMGARAVSTTKSGQGPT